MLEKSQGKMKIAESYRIKDPIENFKLKVKIVQQKSVLAELFGEEGETRDPNFLKVEERSFSWQEKVFAPFEIKFYEDEKNCLTDYQKEYYRRIVEGNVEGSRLFSYTQHDTYCPDDSLITLDFKSYLSKRNTEALSVLRNRKPFAERYNKKVIDVRPHKTRIRSNHYLYQEREVMYILADLTPKDHVVAESNIAETLLCTVTFDRARNILTVNPDFNYDECYIVNGGDMSYNYWIQHTSEKQTHEDLERQLEIVQQEIQHEKIIKEAKIYHEMRLPPSNVLRVFLTLEIKSARNFPYNAPFITYTINLPPYWSTGQRENLTGRTQRCCMRNGIANFGYITEISLDFNLNCLQDDNVLPSWPCILISVASLDSWTRYRIEGYTYVNLPCYPGSHDLSLHTWRPVCGLVNSLRRFFIGGTYELEDITYCSIPAIHEGPKLEKPWLTVVPSGHVNLKINVAHQNKSFLKDTGCEKDVFERLSGGTLMSSVDDVLEQFKAARERMIRARNDHASTFYR
ncbi:Meckel syndrome type 1 protein [Orussus abietinus]|uniref:Meckel syndrome type 1 protein n=1 Tax=Orussus abietinus TaxID=222816 RepID=UPI0006261A66|nr:Meckel syndrome type 1 protein [Orussus abietinus]